MFKVRGYLKKWTFLFFMLFLFVSVACFAQDAGEDAFNKGLEHSRKGETDKAIAEFTKSIEINPNHAEAYYNRGVTYYQKGDPDRAIADYNSAIKINPDFANFYFARAVTYFLKKDYDRAWIDVHKAESLGWPGNPKFLQDLKKASGRDK